MFGFQKIVIMGAQEERLRDPPRHIIAEVVVIDATHPEDGRPTLYQVKETKFSAERTGLPLHSITQLGNDIFVTVGRVVTIDTHSKQIHLANNDLVTYRHLITVGGKRSLDQFHPILYTLLESLRVQSFIKPENLYAASAPSRNRHLRFLPETDSLSCASVIADSTKKGDFRSDPIYYPSACSIQLKRSL